MTDKTSLFETSLIIAEKVFNLVKPGVGNEDKLYSISRYDAAKVVEAEIFNHLSAMQQGKALEEENGNPYNRNLSEQLEGLIALRDRMPRKSFTPKEFRDWLAEKDVALNTFWTFVVNSKSPIRAVLQSPPPDLRGALESVREYLRHDVEAGVLKAVLVLNNLDQALNARAHSRRQDDGGE